MKLLIDGRVLSHGQFTGVERYTTRVIDALKGIGVSPDVALPDNPGRYGRHLWEHTVLPYKARNYDVLFCPANMSPLWKPRACKYVVTIHDISFKLFKDAFKASYRIYHDLSIKRVLRLADRVITDCSNEKKMLENCYPECAGKVRAVYCGLDDAFRAREIIPARAKEKRVLFVGSMNPRKNVKGMIKAFNTIKDRIPHELLIVGPRQEIFTDTGTVKNERIRYAGYVNDMELKRLYLTSALFVLPSFYEGFGLPALEAMGCGCPVITSNVSSLPEVVGNAAVQVDPNDTEGMAEAMLNVLNNETFSDSLIAAGRERANQFTWVKTARQTAEVINECASSQA